MSTDEHKSRSPYVKHHHVCRFCVMDDSMGEENSVRIHFDDEEWDELTILEKKRYANIKRNYDMMKSTGFDPTVPKFMLKRRKTDTKSCLNKPTKEGANPESSEMMQLTKIVKEIRKINSEKNGDIPLSTKTRLMKELGEKVSQIDWRNYEVKLTRKEKKEVSDLLRKSENRLKFLQDVIAFGGGASSGKDPESSNRGPRRRYPKRQVPKVCYTEEEISSEDEFLYCDDCGRSYESSCPVHGPMLFVPDRKVPPGHHADRAFRTCPVFLSVWRSGIRGAGLGIWAEISVPKGVVFGPYKGKVIESRKQAETSGYAWEVRKGGKVDHHVDGSDTSASNWMRFVNCAQHEGHQNMVAFQYGGSIFYRTYKAVLPFTELLVWYGDRYAVELGIDLGEEEPEGDESEMYKGRSSSTSRCFRKIHSDSEETSGSKCSTLSSGTFIPLKNSVARNGWPEYAPRESTASETELDRVRRKMLPCINCGETFNDRWSLKLHRQTHVQKNSSETIQTPIPETILNIQRDEKCPHCEFRTAHSGNLKSHVTAVHMGQKPYKCPHCEYRAARSGHLKRHVTAVHMGQKPYKCPHCEYRAAQPGTLERHVTAVHMGQKPYKCPHCEYKFTQPGNLKRHVTTIHVGQKSSNCN